MQETACAVIARYCFTLHARQQSVRKINKNVGIAEILMENFPERSEILGNGMAATVVM